MKKLFTSIIALLFIVTLSAQVTWQRLHDFPGGRRLGGCYFSINNKGYMGLGIDSSTHTPKDWYEYNPATDTWMQKATFPGNGRWLSTSFSLNGKGYIATGASIGSGLLSDLWEYDPGTDTWTQKASLPASTRQSAFGFSTDSFGYVGGGFIGGSSLVKDFWQYNPRTNTWLQKADYPGANRQGQFAFGIGSSGYVGMGCGSNSSTYASEFFEYDAPSNSWHARATFPGPTLQNAFTANINGEGYVLTGVNGNQGAPHSYQEFCKYNAGDDAWYILTTFTGRGRGYATGFAIGDTIFFGTGSTAVGAPSIDSVVRDFWRTNPLKVSTGIKLVSSSSTTHTIFPNPASAAINIQESETIVAFSFRVYNVSGKLIQDGLHILQNGRMDFDLSVLSKGTYLIEALDKDSHHLWTDKLVKE